MKRRTEQTEWGNFTHVRASVQKEREKKQIPVWKRMGQGGLRAGKLLQPDANLDVRSPAKGHNIAKDKFHRSSWPCRRKKNKQICATLTMNTMGLFCIKSMSFAALNLPNDSCFTPNKIERDQRLLPPCKWSICMWKQVVYYPHLPTHSIDHFDVFCLCFHLSRPVLWWLCAFKIDAPPKP